MWVLTIAFLMAPTFHTDERLYPFQSHEICDQAKQATEAFWQLSGIKVKARCEFDDKA